MVLQAFSVNVTNASKGGNFHAVGNPLYSALKFPASNAEQDLGQVGALSRAESARGNAAGGSGV
jgi:hypothetical protein